MTGGEVWLATIAVAVVMMAAAQLVLAVVAMRTARQATEALQQIRRDVAPIVERAQQISLEAARAAALATSQLERIDRMLASTAARVDETLGVIQGAVVEPVRQGAALISAFRAAFAVLRGAAERQRGPRNEEEALFVG